VAAFLHTFSFADYYDPSHMGFGPLRVINEDRVQPGRGFGTHGHRDMEIISYVLEGGLAHKDSMGNGSVIRPGDVQRMSAGTGVQHSEYNASDREQVHFLQIWIEPNARGIAPGYEEKRFEPAVKKGRLKLIASPDGREGSVVIHQDANVYASLLDGRRRGDARTGRGAAGLHPCGARRGRGERTAARRGRRHEALGGRQQAAHREGEGRRGPRLRSSLTHPTKGIQ
jgi:redox-sensitive bicupin YhaK (pirin superfamily)